MKNFVVRLSINCCALIIAGYTYGVAQFADIPRDYQLLYQQDFEYLHIPTGFTMTDESAWKIAEEGDNKVLELFGKSDYQPKVRSPFNIAYINTHRFGSFILEVELAQTGREYGHRDMCLFYSMKDPSNFYYTHIASVADPHAHNIFLVNDEPRVAIAQTTTEGADWGETGSWHKVRIERNLEAGTIKVFFDNMDTPIMEAEDTHFDYGYIGFGSFDDTGKIDNIKIWGPALAPTSGGLFK